MAKLVAETMASLVKRVAKLAENQVAFIKLAVATGRRSKILDKRTTQGLFK